VKGKNKKIGGGGFHHVAMKAKDFDASVKFYTDALGFKKVISWGEGDKRAIMLDTGDGSCLEIFAGGSKEPAPVGALQHFALRSSDTDLAIQAARAGGAVVTMEPKTLDIPSTPPTPVRIAFCKGPDGELVEFFQNL
jgi:glyoxylase I family protein